MLDIAYYLNTMLEGPTDVNCAPHYDPGLISLSILSTSPGLELQDDNGVWIKGPEKRDIGVVWLGEAAQRASSNHTPLKAAVHRVVYPTELNPRLTIWYEVCTSKQEVIPETTNYPNTNSNSFNFKQLESPAREEKFILTNATHDNAPIVVSSKSKTEALQKIENLRGIPMTKSIIHTFAHET